MNKKYLFILALCLSVALNVVLVFALAGVAGRANASGQAKEANTRVITFTSLFIEKVLMASHDVDFDTRLQLETMVRNLHNQQILDQWQAFTNTKDSQTASSQAKKLLDVLVKNIQR